MNALTDTIKGLFSAWRVDLLQWTQTKLHFTQIVVALFCAAIGLRLIRTVTNRMVAFSQRHPLPQNMRAQQLRTVAGIIQSLGTFVILFLAAMAVLSGIGMDIRPLLASAGIAGLAIGFGAQTLVKDVINGFFILIYDQYEIGDVVKLAGVSGTVEHMRLQNTVLRDGDGTLHIIPNNQIGIVSNLTRDWAQVALHVAVDYTEDSDKVIELLKQVGAEVRHGDTYRDAFVADPEVPGIEKVSGREVDYLFVAKVKPGSQYGVSRELRRRIKETLQKNNIKAGGPAQLYIASNPPLPVE